MMVYCVHSVRYLGTYLPNQITYPGMYLCSMNLALGGWVDTMIRSVWSLQPAFCSLRITASQIVPDECVGSANTPQTSPPRLPHSSTVLVHTVLLSHSLTPRHLYFTFLFRDSFKMPEHGPSRRLQRPALFICDIQEKYAHSRSA